MYIVESHGFLLYTALKKQTYFFHNGNVFVCLCSGNRIHQSMHYFQDYLWLDLIIGTFISYYSHWEKVLSRNNEVINARVC